ncbi:hypothetical protein [Nostoc favosum]|uniref:Uncharacterized protein n=1 Tax=Nostoc favosum CHAB5714 TaxID=2780399 RepID=A0ABS8I574_9NOSO|nr:hypothetical protein [Nostoc favosum]MCC5599121.1 hypothetical protein [Nostoc favosum CHAB5714]
MSDCTKPEGLPQATTPDTENTEQYGSVKQIYLLRQAGGAGEAEEAGGEKKLN